MVLIYSYILYIRFSIGLCSLIVLIAFKNKLKLLFNKIMYFETKYDCLLFVLFIFTYQSKMFFDGGFLGLVVGTFEIKAQLQNLTI